MIVEVLLQKSIFSKNLGSLKLLLDIAVCAHIVNIEEGWIFEQSSFSLVIINRDDFLNNSLVDLIDVLGPEWLISVFLSTTVFELQVHFQQFQSISVLLSFFLQLLLRKLYCQIKLRCRIGNCWKHTHSKA